MTNKLPSAEALANIVNETIQAMYGVPVSFSGECECNSSNANDATIVVPLIGVPLYIITARAVDNGGPALASVMYHCDVSETNPEMIEDALRELCNVVAGQIKNQIAQQHEVGLSSRLLDKRTLNDVHQWSGARLLVGRQRNAEVDIAIAEFDGFS